MICRTVLVTVGLLIAGTALAESLTVDAARHFVVGSMFAYNCFDGTRGAGRVYGDGSVAGTIQVKGAGPVHYVVLPPGTLRVKGQNYCASVRGIPFEPCFNLNRTAAESFRGSVSGLSFAYCDFARRSARPSFASAAPRPAGNPLPISAVVAAEPADTK